VTSQSRTKPVLPGLELSPCTDDDCAVITRFDATDHWVKFRCRILSRRDQSLFSRFSQQRWRYCAPCRSGAVLFHWVILVIFYWDISLICLTVVLKLAVAVFISLYFQTFWPKWLTFRPMTEIETIATVTSNNHFENKNKEKQAPREFERNSDGHSETGVKRIQRISRNLYSDSSCTTEQLPTSEAAYWMLFVVCSDPAEDGETVVLPLTDERVGLVLFRTAARSLALDRGDSDLTDPVVNGDEELLSKQTTRPWCMAQQATARQTCPLPVGAHYSICSDQWFSAPGVRDPVGVVCVFF